VDNDSIGEAGVAIEDGEKKENTSYTSQEIYIPKRSPGIDKIKTKYKL